MSHLHDTQCSAACCSAGKKSKNCMLNKVILESATDIIQKLWDIEWYGTVAKDKVM